MTGSVWARGSMSKEKILKGEKRLIEAEDAEVIIEHHPEDWLAFVLFWSLAFIVFLQFFTRYVLNDSLAWTEEIARYGLMWVVFIGGIMVTRRNTHIAVELLSNVMKPGPLRATLLAFVDFVNGCRDPRQEGNSLYSMRRHSADKACLMHIKKKRNKRGGASVH